MTHQYDLLVITGPTASGKTLLAASVASVLGGEIISADSRQVYRGMDIGTGKDYGDYFVDGQPIKYHLVDIVDAGYRYSVFEYQRDFLKVYDDLRSRSVVPVVCGGSGMYLDSVISGYRLLPVPVNEDLRKELSGKSLTELKVILSGFKTLHNNTDADTVKRAVRAIEIEVYHSEQSAGEVTFPVIRPLLTAVSYEREERRRRISDRLHERLKNGMIEEVERLLSKGVTEETLLYYGLEYKFIMNYIAGRMTYEEMHRSLETAIHQFAKRQMTWFRGMERRGVEIHWIDSTLSPAAKTGFIAELWERGRNR